jgi:hypothetical protein
MPESLNRVITVWPRRSGPSPLETHGFAALKKFCEPNGGAGLV